MRVRLFVDPSKASEEDKKEGVVQDLEYVKALGKRIKDAGFKLMLDFHYSDTWTDPGQHSTPSAWSTLDAEGIADKVYEYTKDCLQQLNTSGATPDFIQGATRLTWECFGLLVPSTKAEVLLRVVRGIISLPICLTESRLVMRNAPMHRLSFMRL